MAIATAVGCLEYSPHALPPGSDRINLRAVEQLRATPPPPVLRFAVIGDTQRSFDESDRVVAALNRRGDLSFAIQIGDFTHLGLLPEFELMNDIFGGLRVPYLVVVGVHEFFANGEDVYRRMFGPYDLAFTHGRVRVVLLNTNSSIFGFGAGVPDLDWLAAQLAPDAEHDRAVVLSHVAPTNPDFDPALSEPYHALLRDAGVTLSLHGHAHRYHASEREGVRYYVADSIDRRSYLLVTAGPGGFEVERVEF